MKKTWICIALSVFFSGSIVVLASNTSQWGLQISSSQASIKEGHFGSVRGLVRDEGVGFLEGVPLVIEGAGARYPVTTDEDGAYEASVPPGSYSIYPRFSLGEPAYGRFRRAKFRVVSGAATVIDLSPYAGFDYCSKKGERLVDLRPTDVSEPKIHKLPPANYDDYLVPQAVGEPLDLVIDFCKREAKNGLIFYKSVTVSFNDMTLYADTVTLRPKDLRLQITAGAATLIAGGEHRGVTHLFSFIGSRTFIELTDGFTESVKGTAKDQSKNISFSLDIEKGGNGKVFYEDREKGITLVSQGEDISFVTTEDPNKVRLSGYALVTSNKFPRLPHGGIYTNFAMTIEANNGKQLQVPSTLSIEIPSIRGYSHSGIIPDGSIKIRRSMIPARTELADSIN